MQLTREQAIAEHRKMWNWIADQIEIFKTVFSIDILKDLYLGTFKGMLIFPVESCFICEYARKKRNEMDCGVSCDYCPVTRANGGGCLGGLYYAVCIAETWHEQAALARQIANLPERTDV